MDAGPPVSENGRTPHCGKPFSKWLKRFMSREQAKFCARAQSTRNLQTVFPKGLHSRKGDGLTSI